MYDVIIAGGGPAGLSAATILGRCRRTVLLCDDGQYRNDGSLELHGFLSRDGIHPAELRRIAREQLERYEVEIRALRVTGAEPSEGGLTVTFEDGSSESCRKLLLATGLRDIVPDVEGFQTFYGRGVFHNPYCDGWEVRDRRLVAYGSGKNAASLARSLQTWSPDVVLCADGASGLKPEEAAALARRGIHVLTGKIARLEGSENGLDRIIFADGSDLPVAAVFLSTLQSQPSDLAARLGCRITGKRGVQTGKFGEAGIPGVYVAGDAAGDLQLGIIAASEGARTAMAINLALAQEGEA
jgi:thioredoxin reductase